jgi:hypothetical protein
MHVGINAVPLLLLPIHLENVLSKKLLENRETNRGQSAERHKFIWVNENRRNWNSAVTLYLPHFGPLRKLRVK